MKRILSFIFTMFMIGAAHAVCTETQIDVNGDGGVCENIKFSVTTTSSTTVLNFSMSAIGTFYVDCGDGGTLTDDAATTTVDGNTITRSDTTDVMYTCTWASAGAHAVRFGGTGTGYSTNEYGAVLKFYAGADGTVSAANSVKIASISGNLYNLFPPIGTANGQIPRFYQTFRSASNITSIPSNLFNGYTNGTKRMFMQTFFMCGGLTQIPESLLSSFTTGAGVMFQSMFGSCSGLTSIPAGLFSKFTIAYGHMFNQTFQSCTGLTTIPSGLFASFTNIAPGATHIFVSTFSYCRSLTSLPADLFSHFTSGAANMFSGTFSGCTNLSGYIPSTLFAGLIANNVAYETDMMSGVFYNTGLDKSCPNGTTRYETPYDSYWSSKVSCTPNVITINWNGALQSDIDANNAGTMIYGGDIRTPLKPDPSQIPVGKYFKGWKFVKPVQN